MSESHRLSTEGRGCAIRVALITAPSSWSGVEVHTMSLARYLSEKGHDVVIVEVGRRMYNGPCQHESIDVRHIDVDRYDGRDDFLGSIGFSQWLKIFRSVPADVAIIAKGAFEFGPLAMEAAARISFPKFCVIEHMHAPLGPRPRAQLMAGGRPQLGLWWYRAKVRGHLRSLFPNIVFCVSNAVAQSLKTDFSYPESKLVVKYAGVDIDRFRPEAGARNRARAALDIPETAFVFGSVGRLSAMKNHGMLVRAFGHVAEALPGLDLRLVIVGEGPKRESLEQEIRRLGLQSRVYLPGFSTAPDESLPGFDVFCLSSGIGESFGIALVEGMAAGIPAIATTVGGVPEILNDERIGWLVPKDDEQAMVNAMRSAAEMDADSRTRMGSLARQSVAERFSAASCWDFWARAICEVVTGKKP